jgi:hypothetical protein
MKEEFYPDRVGIMTFQDLDLWARYPGKFRRNRSGDFFTPDRDFRWSTCPVKCLRSYYFTGIKPHPTMNCT